LEYDYGVPLRQFVSLALLFAFLCGAIAWSWYLSLPRTTVELNNTVYQSSAAFVYVLSIFMLGEPFSAQKTAAVLVSVGGVAACSFGGGSSSSAASHPEPVGYMFVVISTLCFAVYEVLYARYGGGHHGGRGGEEEDDLPLEAAVAVAAGGVSVVRARASSDSERAALLARGGDEDEDEDCRSIRTAPHRMVLHPDDEGKSLGIDAQERGHGHAQVEQGGGGEDQENGSIDEATHHSLRSLETSLMMLGLIGVFTTLFLWPVFLLIAWLRIEPFSWPSARVTQILLANALMDGFYNSILLFGVVIASPLIISVGCMLVTPVSIVVDYLVNGTVLGPVSVLGIFLIVLGFAGLHTDFAAIATWTQERCGRSRKQYQGIAVKEDDGDERAQAPSVQRQ
jgi:drug/metabolite transporter (DMT)-like permease